jgi:hypothetical protein
MAFMAPAPAPPAAQQNSAAPAGRTQKQRVEDAVGDLAAELLKIQGLGPKSIAALWEHYRVSTIDDLERYPWPRADWFDYSGMPAAASTPACRIPPPSILR